MQEYGLVAECKKWHGKSKSKNTYTVQKWKKQEIGWLKCNFGGAWDETGGVGGVGVVIRDHLVNFVAAMAVKKYGVGSPLHAEMEAARAAVLFAQTGLRRQICLILREMQAWF